MNKIKWTKNEHGGNYVLDNEKGKVFLSYQPNDLVRSFGLSGRNLDSENPETAIVLVNDKKLDKKAKLFFNKKMGNRYLIFRGDKRAKLESLYPDIKKLKNYWKKYGGHFWSDSLDKH